MKGKEIFAKFKFCAAGEARKILDGVTWEEVRRLREEKIIPSIKVGRDWIFLRSDIEEHQKNRQKKHRAGDGRIHLKKDLKKS